MTAAAIVLFATLAGGPTPPPTPPAPAMPAPRVEARFDTGRSAREIPVEIAGEGLVFVKGRVRDADGWFLLDTASTSSVLSKRLALKLGLASPEDFLGAATRDDGLPVRILPEVTLRLPGVALTQAPMPSYDLDSLQIALGHRVDGVLGVPFFQSLAVELDYAGATMTLSDPKTFRLSGKAAVLAMEVQAGLAYVEASLALPRKPPIAGSFLIDTGVDNAVVLYSPFVDSRGLLGKSGKPPEMGPAVGGGTLEAVLRAERLELGPFAFRQPIVRLSRSTKGLLADSSHAGLIGGAVLSRFRVTLDLPHLRLGLEKNARYEEPFLDDASGLSLVAQGADLSTFLIRRVSPGSPGSQAGFTAGDVLLAVDGKLAKDIGLRGIRRLLQQDGRRYVLTVFRNGAVKKLTVECRRQL